MGDREEQLEVTINPARMEAYQISHNELYAIITNNKNIPAGQMDTGLEGSQFLCRVYLKPLKMFSNSP